MGIHLLQGLSYHQGAEETKCEAYQWKSYLNRCDFVWPRSVSLKSFVTCAVRISEVGLGLLYDVKLLMARLTVHCTVSFTATEQSDNAVL